jgi:hypothetical protein
MIKTIIAPYGTVTDVREAADAVDPDLLGDGLKLESRGRAWDAPLSSAEKQALEDAGAETHDRPAGKFLSDIVEQAGYTLDPPESL